MTVDTQNLLALCKRRGFVYPSFEIYGGVSGMYDYGPLGCILKNNIVEEWRSIYKVRENFVEIDSEIINPKDVFKASGHVDNFADFITYCQKCHAPFRADHIVKEFCDNSDALTPEEINEAFARYDVKCSECGGDLGPVGEFNLMFKTNIGPGSARVGYLRPETAQGIFANYLNLYRYNREKLPLGVMQTGRSYRNEIAPRQCMIRMREFNQMEAELFVDPENKSWDKFSEVENEYLDLIPNTTLELTTMTVKEAVDRGVIANQVLAYFVYTTKQLLTKLGIDPKRLRFREHEKNEMAHYATDCWDAEVLLTYGWTEIVGIADRGSWDLSRHALFSGQDMSHFKKFDVPREIEKDVIKARNKALGPRFKERASKIAAAIEALSPIDVKNNRIEITINDEKIDLDERYFEVVHVKEKVTGERIVPHVIEPSHGLDRIFYSILEHAYEYDEKKDYTVLHLAPTVAPVKVGVFPLMEKDGLDRIAYKIYESLHTCGIEACYDGSGTIGKRYARMDEIGTPWCITVDYETIDNNCDEATITIRDRDSKEQRRIKISEIKDTINRLLEGNSFFDL